MDDGVSPAPTDKIMSDNSLHLHVSEAEYAALIEKLCRIVGESGWEFDAILCLARGGLRIGDVLSRIMQKPLAILATSSYRADAGTTQSELHIASHISFAHGEFKGRVLLADDLADSGHTLAGVIAWLAANHPAISEVKTAVLWAKSRSIFVPDFAVERLTGNPWIHQPFEKYDEK